MLSFTSFRELGKSGVFPVKMDLFVSDICQLLWVVCGCSEVGKVLGGGLSLIIFSKPCFSIVKDVCNESLFKLLWVFLPSQASQLSAT